MLNQIKNLLRDSWFYIVFHRVKGLIILKKWERQGRPVPPPYYLKHKMIRDLQKKYQKGIFVETGTYMGETLLFLQSKFNRLYSLELDVKLHTAAIRRLAKYKNITLIQGDSGKTLPELLKTISISCFFFLDGHFSGGQTAKGETDTPVSQELKAIMSHGIKDHLILIDDMRLFNGESGYPTLSEVEKYVRNNGYKSEVRDDIMVIYN